MTLALISVCMPAYNAGKYISEAVNSVLTQSYKNLELIIINDGSTDNTAEELSNITDKRVFVYHQNNQGQSAAANAAYNKSSGKLIKFMDADDIISPDFIENQINRLGTREDAVVSAAWGRFYSDDLSTFKLSPEDVWKDMNPLEWLITSWQNTNSMMQCALWLIPRKILDSSGFWDEKISLINDLDFFTRVLLNCRQVLFEPNAVLYYRSGLPSSLSGTKGRKAIISAYTSMDKATGNLLAVDKNAPAIKACANIWQSFIYNYYPHQPDIIAAAQKKIDELGGSALKFQSGGITRTLIAVVGWKMVQKLKALLKK